MALPRKEETRGKTAPVERASSVKAYWIRSLIGTALVLLLASVLAIYLWVDRVESGQRRQLAGGTNLVAQSINANLAHIPRLLETMRSDPQLQAAFAAADPQRLREEEKALASRIPGTLGIRLFVPEPMTSAQGIPFMSYAGLDLARQAAQTQSATQIEVHRVGQPGMHLAIAAPVVDAKGEQTLGVIHVALPMSLLPDPAGVVGELGTVRYQQVVGEGVATLQGSGPPPAGDPDYVAPIGGTRLQAAAWLNHDGFVDPWTVAQFVVAYLIVLGLIGAALWAGYRALRRDLIQDGEGIAAVVDDAIHGRPLRVLKPRLAETRGAYEEIMTKLAGLQSSRRPAVDAGDLRGPSATTQGGRIDVEELAPPESDAPGAAQAGETERPAHTGPMEDFDALKGLYGEFPADESIMPNVAPEIFRAYDIRGVVDRQLTAETMSALGRALGSEASARGDDTVMVGRDLRASSPRLTAALAEGIRAAGLDVVDLGVVPTPLVYFACCYPVLHSGAMVTASHNPSEYNGVKPVLMGESADSSAIQGLRLRIEQNQLAHGSGGYRREDLNARYRNYITQDVTLARPHRVVIDCGNATASLLAPQLYRDLGCEVIELNCDMDAGMGDRMPDPSVPEQLRDLGDLVRTNGADIGLAFDGDGDRLGVVDSQGRFVAADRVLMLLAADVLARNPGGDVVFDVKCSRYLAEEIQRAGGRPLMWKSGHTPLKAKLRESGALIAGELSGHFIFRERWFGFDDALYAGARLLEVLSLDPRSSEEIFAGLPGGIATPELFLPLAEGEPTRVMESVLNQAKRLDGVNLILIDGLRAELEGGWGLVRASNTQPKLTFRFEGDDQESLEQAQALFRRLMEMAAPELTELPF
jgi:phosphomannomutase/phosphoglucomutase